MASVRFNLRRNKTQDPQIYLVYRLDSDRKKLKIGTGIHVPDKYWNQKEMKVRETSEFMDHQVINTILSDWKNAVNTVNKKYLLSNQTPSLNKFKEEVIAQMKGENLASTTKDFIKYYEGFIEMKKSGSVTKNTLKQYQNALNKVNEYRKSKLKGRNLDFDDLMESFFTQFINFLRYTQELQDNTIHKIIKKIRTVINHATKKGINTLLDYKSFDCQVSYIKQPKIFLTLAEIDKIRILDLEPFSRLDKVRDSFIIGMRTGLRYIDFIRINQDFITTDPAGKKIIEIYTVKDKKLLKIPLPKELELIIQKYNGYPPTISLTNFNKYLQELCKKAGITTKVSRIENDKQVTYEKYQLVGSHICRRSFATNGFLQGIPPKLLMAITRHSTVKQFMEYICIDDSQTKELLSNYDFML